MSAKEILSVNNQIAPQFINTSQLYLPVANITGLQRQLTTLQDEINNVGGDFVPYTGADQTVDLNTQTLVVPSITNATGIVVSAPNVVVNGTTTAGIVAPTISLTRGLPLSCELEVNDTSTVIRQGTLNLDNNPISNVLSISTLNIAAPPTDAVIMTLSDTGPAQMFASLEMFNNNITDVGSVTATTLNVTNLNSNLGVSSISIPETGSVQINRNLDMNNKNITTTGTTTTTNIKATNYKAHDNTAGFIIPNVSGAIQLQATRDLDVNTNNITNVTSATATNINATNYRSNNGSTALAIPNTGAITCSRNLDLGSNTLTGNINSSSGVLTVSSVNSGDGNICFAFGNAASVSYTYRNINFQGAYGIENTTFIDTTTANVTNIKSRNGTDAIIIPNTGAIQLQASRDLDVNTNNLTNVGTIGATTTTTTNINNTNYRSNNGTAGLIIPNSGAIQLQASRDLDLNVNNITNINTATASNLSSINLSNTNYRSNDGTAGLTIPNVGAIQLQASRNLDVNTNNITNIGTATATSVNATNYRSNDGTIGLTIPNTGAIQLQTFRDLDANSNNITNVTEVTSINTNATNYNSNDGTVALLVPNTGAIQLQASRDLDVNSNNITNITTATGTNLNATNYRSNNGTAGLSIPNTGSITFSKAIDLGSNAIQGSNMQLGVNGTAAGSTTRIDGTLTAVTTGAGSHTFSAQNINTVISNADFSVITSFGSLVLNAGTGFVLSTSTNQIQLNSSNVVIPSLGTGTGTDLVLNASNQLVRNTSSRRYKENIVNLVIDTTKIFNLQPKSFNYKDQDKQIFGLIAEDVNETLPELVNLDSKDQPESISYALLSVLLLEEVKKLRADVDILKQQVINLTPVL